MKLKIIIYLVMSFITINQVQCIAKYEFNVCRIQNCVSRQQSCIEDQGTCLKGFSDTRKCLNTCTSEDELQNYNKCWQRCKNSIANSNSLYIDLALCYEQICYVYASHLQIGVVIVSLLLSLIVL